MITVDLRDAAVASILNQADYYASIADERLAQRWERAIDQTLLQLTRFPAMGSPCFFQRPDLSGLRRIAIKGFSRHLLFYRFFQNEGLLEVLDIIHGARDIEALLTLPLQEE